MRKVSKEKITLIALIVACIVTMGAIVGYYIWVQYDNEQMHTIKLSDGEYNGEAYVLQDFTAVIQPRGGDAGAWNKDPIYDDAGNELHGQSVGTIYELTLTNTSKATITDWSMELYIPEYMWLNNAWNGTLEFHQTTSGSELVQELDLREFKDSGIELDHYIDHTGPMIAMNPGDRFIYHPNKSFNEMPLVPQQEGEEVNCTALIGFIVYIPDAELDYITNFDTATFHYHLERNPWVEPYFDVLVVLEGIWIVLLFALLLSQIRVRKLLKQQEHDAQIIEQSIQTFINFVEAKDPNTKGHSERVAKISYALAKEMGYSQRECNRIYYIALMHDCGKISVPVNILLKPGKLTDEEYEVIKSHTIYGEKMLRDFSSIEGIDLGALYHHERYDGKGYPHGLSGENIPVIARIICVADSLDAMNSNRCYRPRLTRAVILEELENNKGKQFDPEVVEHLIKLIKQNIITIGE